MLVAPLYLLVYFCLYKHAASEFFDENDIFSQKMSLKRRRKIDRRLNQLILLDLHGIMHRQ